MCRKYTHVEYITPNGPARIDLKPLYQVLDDAIEKYMVNNTKTPRTILIGKVFQNFVCMGKFPEIRAVLDIEHVCKIVYIPELEGVVVLDDLV